jgi:pimeloyl-ACP methyl ester carboxylesterase
MALFKKKQDVVILHGWNLSAPRFAPLKEALTTLGYNVHTLDLPGFGKEPAPEKSWHIVEYADFLKGYFQRKRITNAVLIGHSFGGRVALKFAQLHPQALKAIVLTGTPGFSPVPKGKLLLFLLVAKIGRVLFSVPPLTFFADWARRLLYYVAGAKDFFRAEGVMKQTFKNVVQDSLVEAMETLAVPCLLIWGEFDVIVPVAIARQIHEVLPRSELKVVPQADHGVPFKESGVFASYVDRFVKGL